ncbi:type VI secretion protein [Streptomyces sp. 7-21]|uniref:type VI secretion protein n=1 Tax=Streptomyces sp. 7-21 TaxID=2802283 RepID=UPI00191E7DF3|nr:type VI secretion protein [Streptomyces sp. 7-21]MBL1068644.1 type VI secretion protein [Streptomyces sp. 7-21]
MSEPDVAGKDAKRGGGVPDVLLVGALGSLVGLAALVWTSTGLGGIVAHGAWPEGVAFTRTGTAVRSFLTAPGDVAAAWPRADPRELPGPTLLWLVFLTQVVVAFATVLLVSIQIARLRARRKARRIAAGGRRPVTAADPPPAARAERRPAEPEIPAQEAPAPQFPQGREAAGHPAPAPVPAPAAPSAERPADPVSAVLAAPEGLLVVDPGGKVWAKTARQRAKRGPVHVYDPGHVTDAPVRLRWAPQRGCEDMAVARRRAAALLAPVRPAEPVFQLDAEAAETLLRCYLHAAALAGEPFPQVLRWSGGKHGRSEGEPGKILRNHPRAAGGASMELESALTTHPGRRDAALGLIGRALAGLEQLHIRQACSPGRVDALALDNLTGEGGTLYVVGDHRETAGLRAALADAVTAEQPSLTVVRA